MSGDLKLIFVEDNDEKRVKSDLLKKEGKRSWLRFLCKQSIYVQRDDCLSLRFLLRTTPDFTVDGFGGSKSTTKEGDVRSRDPC